MGKRGPKPTPTNTLRLRGSWLADERVDEPETDGKRPVCPSWLCDEGKSVWRRLVPKLDAMLALGSVDVGSLARYCQTFGKWMKAEAAEMERGQEYPVKDKAGNVVEIREYPHVRRAERLAEQLRKDEVLFGLNPSARAGLAKKKEPNPLENRGKGRWIGAQNAG